jgi:hypothetical protein
MIRRDVGAEYWLFFQHDHARLAAEIAAALRSPLSDSARLGIELHDIGWKTHDDNPTVDSEHRPLDVFETPRQLALPIWQDSAQQAADRDPFAGLLVSLHGLALSLFATGASPLAGCRWDMAEPRVRFEVNRFQHRMIEMQESLRRKLGLSVNLPLQHGLAEQSTDPRERQLEFDYRWLAVMDQISLCICCTNPPFQCLQPAPESPGGKPMALDVRRPDSQTLTLSPWPFNSAQLNVSIPYRPIPVREYPDDAALRAEFGAAPTQQLSVALREHTI